ncbi:unnamed protein product [Toxocara canis]|uniref:Secreted protein n=1 Tax=Toxocara canis TaxID=6265 RepID=A0A183U4I5_TOXCA|nr:unnamed protein product [Toxocara canis]
MVTVAAAAVAEVAAISEMETTATAELVDRSSATSSGSGWIAYWRSTGDDYRRWKRATRLGRRRVLL